MDSRVICDLALEINFWERLMTLGSGQQIVLVITLWQSTSQDIFIIKVTVK